MNNPTDFFQKGAILNEVFKVKSIKTVLVYLEKKHIDYNWSEYNLLLRLHKKIQGLATAQLPIDSKNMTYTIQADAHS